MRKPKQPRRLELIAAVVALAIIGLGIELQPAPEVTPEVVVGEATIAKQVVVAGPPQFPSMRFQSRANFFADDSGRMGVLFADSGGPHGLEHYLALSRDGGEHFADPLPLTSYLPQQGHSVQCAIAPGAGDTLFLAGLTREPEDARQLVILRSDDFGATFTPWVDLSGFPLPAEIWNLRMQWWRGQLTCFSIAPASNDGTALQLLRLSAPSSPASPQVLLSLADFDEPSLYSLVPREAQLYVTVLGDVAKAKPRREQLITGVLQTDGTWQVGPAYDIDREGTFGRPVIGLDSSGELVSVFPRQHAQATWWQALSWSVESALTRKPPVGPPPPAALVQAWSPELGWQPVPAHIVGPPIGPAWLAEDQGLRVEHQLVSGLPPPSHVSISRTSLREGGWTHSWALTLDDIEHYNASALFLRPDGSVAMLGEARQGRQNSLLLTITDPLPGLAVSANSPAGAAAQ